MVPLSIRLLLDTFELVCFALCNGFRFAMYCDALTFFSSETGIMCKIEDLLNNLTSEMVKIPIKIVVKLMTIKIGRPIDFFWGA